MVEQGTHKPLVVGSNPTLATVCTYLAVWFQATRTCGGKKGDWRHAEPNRHRTSTGDSSKNCPC